MLEFTTEQESFRSVVREFAESEIRPYAEEWDRDHKFPTSTVQAMGQLGLFGLMFSEEWGGSNAGLVTQCLAIEEIGRVDQSMGITLEAAVSLGARPIAEYGTEDQKAQWLPDLVSGQRLAGFGLTEPDGGSDAGSTATRAEQQNDECKTKRKRKRGRDVVLRERVETNVSVG